MLVSVIIDLPPHTRGHFVLRLIITLSLFLYTGFINAQDRELVICGDDEINIVKIQLGIKDTVPDVVWTWKSSEAEVRQSLFTHMDECKPVNQGHEILATSSDGGVVLVDVESKQVLFEAFVGNAHSAEMLPDRRIVVAGSTNKEGNRISVFDIENGDEPLYTDSLYSGHGVVWDEKRELLFALGYDELRSYELVHWLGPEPKLRLTNAWKIPGEGGHDLSGYDSKLIVSEHNGVWVFDPDKQTFEPFAPLAGRHDVKAVSLSETDRLVFIQAEVSWWSTHVYLKDPERTLSFPGRHLYKVRWR